MCLALPYAILQIFLPSPFILFFLTLQEFKDDYTDSKARILNLDRCVHHCSSLESVLKVSAQIHENHYLLLGRQFSALLKLQLYLRYLRIE